MVITIIQCEWGLLVCEKRPQGSNKAGTRHTHMHRQGKTTACSNREGTHRGQGSANNQVPRAGARGTRVPQATTRAGYNDAMHAWQRRGAQSKRWVGGWGEREREGTQEQRAGARWARPTGGSRQQRRRGPHASVAAMMALI